MKLETFFQKFDQFADAPDAVTKMRELVLDLAVQGKVVEPKASDGDGNLLLKKLRTLPPERNSKSRSPKDIVVEPETPLDVPSHWALTTVENTTRETGFFCDGDWVETKDQDPDGDVRLIQLADVGDGEYRDRSSRFMTNATAKRLNCSYLEEGDILVARMPDPLGRCCRFPGDSKPAVTVVDVCILRPNIDFFDPDFLVIAINCPRFRRLVSAQATGTTRSRISRSNLGVLPIPLPPLAEQKRIVAKVDELMALCDRLALQQQERETRHAALARASLARFADAPTPANLTFLFHPSYAIPPADLRKSILTLAVQGKLVPQDPNDVSVQDSVIAARKKAGLAVRALAELASDETSFEVPESWRWVTVADVADARLGKMLDKEKNRGEAHPYLRNTNVHWFRFELESIKTMLFESAELDEYRVESGDVLICEGGHGIARSAVWDSQIPGIMFQKALHRVRPLSCLNGHFLTFCLWVYERDEILQRYYTGAGIPHFTGKALARVTFPLPPLAEQRRIVAKVEQLMALVDALETQLATSCATGEKLLAAVVAELTEGTHASPAC
jgi:type I restriction enzyme S subunit